MNDTEWKALKRKLARARKAAAAAGMGEPEKEYVLSRGTDILRLHATDFVKKRLAPAFPKNDGRQTPLKGHPVFIAQHATGTSDRTQLEQFHGIKTGAPLTDRDVDYIVGIILRWIAEQTA